MRNSTKTYLFILWLLLCVPLHAQQQLVGTVLDAETGETVPKATLIYEGHDVHAVANLDGKFTIARHNGWTLTVRSVGYKPYAVEVNAKTKARLKIELTPEVSQLQEVKVKAKRERYSRKNNPAVELMQRVIAAKKNSDLSLHDYYHYTKYEKMTLAHNDLTPEMLKKKPFTTEPWLLDQVEMCPYNNRLILPLNVTETVSEKLYRRSPHAEKTIIRGENSTGLNDLFETGDVVNVAVKDIFTNVNLYDDQIRLLQYPFTSPIGKDAIAFYRYYITDTVLIGGDSCIHLEFTPNNQQDFGFSGDLYILYDSTLHVRRCELNVPSRTDVNFVENLWVQQEYMRLDNGEWVLSQDDMITELMVTEKSALKAIVIRTTRYSDYDFAEQSDALFRGRRSEEKEPSARMRDDAFWDRYRQVQLSKSESQMDEFLRHVKEIKGFKYIIFGLQALIENFVETDHPSKVDIGPVNTIVTRNFIDDWRVRASAQTTANLNKHFFGKGYYAYGIGSNKHYYSAEAIYSLNAKDYLPREFPKRTFSLLSTYDVCSPSDKFVPTDKDNMFVSLKWDEVDKMMFYNRQQATFEYEDDWGMKGTLHLKTEADEPCGGLHYVDMAGDEIKQIRTTELHAELRIAPGETYINTKQRRMTINNDRPVLTIGHTVGFKDFLGSDYSFNLSELRLYKRFWMKSWGKIDSYLKVGYQWDKVPYPLLCMPAANLSYLMENETFYLVNNMEFLNDRYASLMVSWDMNGKILNRIPLVHHLKWREFIGVNVLWGDLSAKNDPFLESNAADAVLMQFPERSYTMDYQKPYVEVMAGFHNIFKLLHIEYVRRLNYLNLPTAKKWGIRFTFRVTF